jgi:hypothetical protein
MPSQPLNRLSVVRLNGAFEPQTLATIASRVESMFSNQQPRSERDSIRAAQGVAVDETRFNPLWNSVWETVSLELVNQLGDFVLVSYPPQVRWIRTITQLVPWHQDIAYVRHIGHVITCFVPLDASPTGRSTIEFGDYNGDELKHEPESVYNGFKIERVFDKQFHFNLNRGDCLLFGDLAPHRTFVPEGGELERMSLEFRLVNLSERRQDKDYYDIRK